MIRTNSFKYLFRFGLDLAWFWFVLTRVYKEYAAIYLYEWTCLMLLALQNCISFAQSIRLEYTQKWRNLNARASRFHHSYHFRMQRLQDAYATASSRTCENVALLYINYLQFTVTQHMTSQW